TLGPRDAIPQTRATPNIKNDPIRSTIWNATTLQWSKKHCQASFRGGSSRAHDRARDGNQRGAKPLDLPDVGGLQALGAASDLEFDGVTLGQGLEALGLDGGVVNEDVLSTILRDESVPLGLVEPLDSSVCHASVPRTFLGGRAPCYTPH